MILFSLFVGLPLAIAATVFFLMPARRNVHLPSPSATAQPSAIGQDNEQFSSSAGAETSPLRAPDPEMLAEEAADPTPQVDTSDVLRPDRLSPAVAAALNTGKAAMVDLGDRSSQVRVSEPVVINTGTCRNVSIEDEQATWCRKPGSDWALAQ